MRRPKNEERLLVCEYCGGGFTTTAYQTKYCGDTCKSRAADLRRRLKTYGISAKHYDRLLAKQHNQCAICSAPLSWAKTKIDHDHATGKVRGLLCNSCNLGIGLLGDTYEAVKRAAAYLRRAA